MNSADLLKQARSSGYGASTTEKGEESDVGPRSFPLTAPEMEAIGEDVTCVKAYGHHENGKFHIDHIEPDVASPGNSEVMVKTPTQVVPG